MMSGRGLMGRAWVLVFVVGCASEAQYGEVPSTVCGDGVLSPGEICVQDEPAMMDPGIDEIFGCPSDTPATCGNGLIDPGEMCDEGDPGRGIQANFGENSCASFRPGTSGPLQCSCCLLLDTMCLPSQMPVGGQGG